MGTDIFMFVEKFDGSAWQLQPSTCRDEYSQNIYEYDIGRDYDVFAVLAGVRNRRGIVPVLTWLCEKEAVRGRPADLSAGLSVEDDPKHGYEWPGDDEACSWIMAEELDRAFKTGYLALVAWPDATGKVKTYGQVLEWFIKWFDEHVRPVGKLHEVRLVFYFSG